MGGNFSKDILDVELNDFNKSGFSDQQLEIISQNFKDACYPEHTLSIERFAKLSFITVDLARPIFEFINMNGDDWIDEYEFICGLALFIKSDFESRIQGIYGLYDKDQTLSLDHTELSFLIKMLLMAGSKGKLPSDK